MCRVFLLRHGRSEANAAGVLAGRSEAALDERGEQQAAGVAQRLSAIQFSRILVSPMLRTRQTAQPLAELQGITPEAIEGFSECDYGDWTGRKLSDLASEPLWRAVQAHPSTVTFPGGESMALMSHRAVFAMRDATLGAEQGENILVVSHGDVIKALLADALGMHLDLFQRIVVQPASVSVVSYPASGSFVERVNDCGGDLADLQPAPRDEAVPGGATGG